jgi:glycosyltransferase involved in cell wall biosynthesis
MQILFIHTKGYHSSGPETYLQNMSRIFDLENVHYDLFCLDYDDNDFNNILPKMPKPIGSSKVYRYSDQRLSVRDKVRVLMGSIFRFDVNSRLDRVLKEKKYDKIIVLQYFLKLSPAIFWAAKKNSVEVIFRQSDFGLICAKNTLYRDGAICQKCTKNQFSMVVNNCGSGWIYSLFLYFIYKINHIFIRYANPTIIWTNQNSFNIGSQSRVLKRLNHSLNYTPIGIDAPVKIGSDKIYDFGYFGRISVDKGLDIFLEQLLRRPELKFNVIFIGNIDTKLIGLVNKVKIKHQGRIIFLGKVPRSSVSGYMDKCRYLLFMSNWFDNLPNSLIEAYSRGIPCILPDFGCFSEFIPSDFSSLGYVKGIEIPLDEFTLVDQEEYLQMSDSVRQICHNKFSNIQHLRIVLNEASPN